MGRHRADDEMVSPTDPALAPVRSRVWGNPVAVAAIGLVVAIVAVCGGWVAFGRDTGSPMVYPWTTNAPAPIDVTVTLVPPPASLTPSASAVPTRAVSRTPKPSASLSTGPSASPTTVPGSAVTVQYAMDNFWPVRNFQGHFLVVNTSDTRVGFGLQVTFPAGTTIYGSWNIRRCPGVPANMLVGVSEWELGAGQSVSVGFQATYAAASAPPSPAKVSSQLTGCPSA